MLFWLVNGILVVIILCLFILLSWVWPPDSPWAPWWTTKPDVARAMCKLAKVNKKSIIYDLGCGTAGALIVAAKECGATGIGIEIDPTRYLLAKANILRHHLQNKIALRKNNFFDEDISKATIVFVYLVPAALARLSKKFQKELHKNTIIVSYRYPLPVGLYKGGMVLQKYDKKNSIFVYKYH